MTLRFGDCRFDPDARLLFRGGAEVHLSPKAFELLRTLIDERPRAMSKNDLLERVWPGVFVSEASLARAVTEIRDGVGEEPSQARIIRTVHGYGYAFAAEAVEDSGGPHRAQSTRRPVGWLTCGAREFALWHGEQVLGRDADMGIYLDSPKVSRRHARILAGPASLTIEDLRSKNGTFVRGERIARATPLAPGDEIQVGPFTLVLTLASGPGTTETQIA